MQLSQPYGFAVANSLLDIGNTLSKAKFTEIKHGMVNPASLFKTFSAKLILQIHFIYRKIPKRVKLDGEESN
jgi:hypothetical protein